MPDIIHLLPDSVANQIAAGEVIQRPASAVKELMENAVDSGASDIKLIVKDAGKVSIKVIDNGCGMSETDARMSFERHATSKINTASDLFAIKTLGFRGEALASMAAIAHVELKTKRIEDEIGTCINIEGTLVKSQEAWIGKNGTSISISNLFFNVPARRKFLKSNTTELRHIIEEFQRIALVNPKIKFSFYNENRQIFSLNDSNLKQRIASLFGSSYSTRLVPMEQNSEIVSISGFIGKPEFARKTRGEQYFFVNGRFIKHPYLNHAVDNAFKELIPADAYPSYFIYFNIDPKDIDINIHPTKTEVSFQNNQVIYAMLSSAVKQAIGKFNIAPSIDFENESSINFSHSKSNSEISSPTVKIDTNYNPFEKPIKNKSGDRYNRQRSNVASKNWESLYPDEKVLSSDNVSKGDNDQNQLIQSESEENDDLKTNLFQLHNNYIVSPVKSGMMIIDQQRAFERILFEKFSESFKSGKALSQQQLFPITLEFPQGDIEIINSLKGELETIGFDMEEFGKNTFIINGIPSELNNDEVKDVLENIIENFKINRKDLNIDKKNQLSRTMAINMASRCKKRLKDDEIKSLVNQLFACQVADISPDGNPIVRIISMEDIKQKFE